MSDYQTRRLEAQKARRERDKRIGELVAVGWPSQDQMTELARQYDVTRERIRQIAKAARTP